MSPTNPYVAAVVGVALSALLRLAADPLLGSDAPMLMFVLGVTLAAVRGGVAGGVAATLMSIPVGAYLFIEPRGTILPARAEDAVRLAIFTAEGLIISYATGQLRARVQDNTRLAEQVRRQNESLENEVARRTAELQASNEALETFAHTISHDIRAPLRSIRSFAEIIEEDFGAALPPEGREYTTRIAAAAHRLEELVSNLLAYTRLGRRAVPHEPVSLDRVVDAALAGMDVDIRRAGAAVTVASPLGGVSGHPETVALMVANLLSNALKFVRPGQPPAIAIASRENGGTVRLSVRDNGIGVPAAEQAAIFNAFNRLHSSQHYAGSGLGLALVARGAERMGGRYGVISDGTAGSEFWIELPAAAGGGGHGTSAAG